MLSVGTKAPDFSLPDQNGTMRSLSDFSGKRIVLYFYSKDMTSGCTKQACGFAELYPQFTEKDTQNNPVLYISIVSIYHQIHKILSIQFYLHVFEYIH